MEASQLAAQAGGCSPFGIPSNMMRDNLHSYVQVMEMEHDTLFVTRSRVLVCAWDPGWVHPLT
jgi:hypothetical protein